MAGFCDIINFKNKIDNFKKLSKQKEHIYLIFNDREKNIQELIKRETNTSSTNIITDCIEIKPYEKCLNEKNTNKIDYNSCYNTCYKCIKYSTE